MHEQAVREVLQDHGSDHADGPYTQTKGVRVTALIVLIVLLANAAVVLFFQYFITVDGPIHVLHAYLLEGFGTGHTAQYITYDTSLLRPWLGHRILMIMLWFVPPAQAHDLFAAFVCCSVIVSVIALLRAHGTRMGPAFLWLVPITFNVLLLMGLFNFLLGVAISFGTVAWWVSRTGHIHWRYAGLLLGALLAWSAHRGAPMILCLVVLPTLLIGLKERIAALRRSYITGLHIIFMGSLLGFLALAIWQVAPFIKHLFAHGLPTLNEILILRALTLSVVGIESWSTYAIGLLLLISLCAGACARWNVGRAIQWHDTYLALFIGSLLVTWLFHSPQGQRFLLVDRAGWLALVFLLIWLVAIADIGKGWHRRVIIGTALCAMPLHVVRMVQAATHFSGLRIAHERTMEAREALLPGSLVLPVVAGTEKLLQHLKAYMAMDHDGIFISLDKRFPLRSTTPATGATWLRRAKDPLWMVRNWRNGIPGEVDQVLFLGNDIERRVNSHPWNKLLIPHYTLTFSNEYAQVYTAVRKLPDQSAVESIRMHHNQLMNDGSYGLWAFEIVRPDSLGHEPFHGRPERLICLAI